MQDQRVGNTHVLRLDRGEEIVAELTRFCTSRGIGLGLVTGIGAVDRATIGLFRPAEKRYEATELTGDHEILSLAGNITTLNGEVYLHLHINLGDAAHRAWGGHLNAAVVSATAEIFVTVLEGTCERAMDETVGLNLMRFGSSTP
ncbi:MAG TPA: DNA-binding protein [Syntrophales bacterium]|nr:DNA-binding protein [Syntrophales bacterium]